jgi:hypothetical protein
VKGTGSTTLAVSFDKPHDYVTIKIYTTAFRKIYQYTAHYVQAGIFTLSLDTAHINGGSMANGVYYVVITTPSNRWISKLLVLR